MMISCFMIVQDEVVSGIRVDDFSCIVGNSDLVHEVTVDCIPVVGEGADEFETVNKSVAFLEEAVGDKEQCDECCALAFDPAQWLPASTSTVLALVEPRSSKGMTLALVKRSALPLLLNVDNATKAVVYEGDAPKVVTVNLARLARQLLTPSSAGSAQADPTNA